MDPNPTVKLPEGTKFCPFLSTNVVTLERPPASKVAVPGVNPAVPTGRPKIATTEVVPIPCAEYGMPCALWDDEYGHCTLARHIRPLLSEEE